MHVGRLGASLVLRHLSLSAESNPYFDPGRHRGGATRDDPITM